MMKHITSQDGFRRREEALLETRSDVKLIETNGNVNHEFVAWQKLQRQKAREQELLLDQLEQQDPHAPLKPEIDATFSMMLASNAKRKGLKLLNPLSAINHKHRLLEHHTNHHCSSVICDIFNLPPGYPIPDYTNQGIKLRSSGLIFICRRTGSVHICDKNCSAVSIDPYNQNHGYVCQISNAFKGNYNDDLPQGKDVKISRARVEQIEVAQIEGMLGSNYSARMGDSDGEDDGDYGEAVFEKKKKGVKYDKAKLKTQSSILKRATRTLETPILEIPSGSVETLKRQNSDEESESKRVKIDHINPDDRTAHFLKGMEKRAKELDELLYILLSYDQQVKLWYWHLSEQGHAAHEVLYSFQRRCNYELSEAECYLRWLNYVVHNSPPVPKYLQPGDPSIYAAVVLKAWSAAAHSPYARDAKNNRFVPNFSNITLGVLYCMSTGGYTHDCSLSEEEFPVLPHLEGWNLRDQQIEFLPDAKNLAARILKQDELPSMQKIVSKQLKIGIKYKTKGWRSMKECFTSSVNLYRLELSQKLADPNANSKELIIAYLKQCVGLVCKK